MSAITQAQKNAVIKDLDLLKQKLMAYELNPTWAAAGIANAGDPALTYALEKTAIQAAVTEIDSVIATWVT
jgi:hypothetical protein